MSETKSPHGGLTRRSFLKSTGAVAGVAAVAGTGAAYNQLAPRQAHAEDAAQEEVFTTFCRGNCGSYGCNLGVHVRDGKVTRVASQPYPDADPKTKGRGRVCLRGLSNLQRLYAPERLDYPMRRVEGTARGEGQWERIGWDEAIASIAEKWKSYTAQEGPGSIARWPIYGNQGSIQGQQGVGWMRLVNSIGMATIANGADMAQMYMGNVFTTDSGIGSDPPAFKHAKHIIIWGTNPVETQPHEWRYVIEAKQQGTKLIVVDPRVSPTACKSDKHIRLRAASDAALGLGVCNYLIEQNLIDVEFLLSRSAAPCLVKPDGLILRKSAYGYVPNKVGMNTMSRQVYTDDTPYVWDEAQGKAVEMTQATSPALSGTYDVDGQPMTTTFDLLAERVAPWTLERTAEVCDIAQEDVIALAEALADGPTSVMFSNGAGHYENCHSYYSASFAAAVLTGNFFKPGAGWGSSGIYGGMWFPSFNWGYPEKMNPGPQYSALDFPDIMETQKAGGKPAVIKSILVHGGNPLGNAPNRQAMLKAMDKVEFLVVVDMAMTDTARYADLVLPCGHWFEVNDIAGAKFVPYALIGEKAVELMFERKSDFEIAKLLAEALDMGDVYNLSEQEVVELAVDNSPMPDVDGKKITYGRLKKEKNIRIRKDGGYQKDCKTQDDLLMFYWEKPVPRIPGRQIDVDLERLPYFKPPAEAWPEDVGEYGRNPLADKYPLIFHSYHNRYTTHTTYGHVSWLCELRPEPYVNLSPEDAKSRDIVEGDKVKVFNDRGYVVVKAQIDGGLKPGIVNLPHGWQGDQFEEGHYQDLTTNVTHPLDDNENYYDCLCEVEKWKGGDVR